MGIFLDDYRAGDLSAWDRLVADKAIGDDALKIAELITIRALDNIKTLHSRLTSLGYQFNSKEVFRIATKEDVRTLESTEKEFGRFPLILHVWFCHAANVSGEVFHFGDDILIEMYPYRLNSGQILQNCFLF